MSEELPRGWVKTTLGEIAEPARERALPTEFPDMRYVGLEHIEPQTMKLLRYGYAREARSSSVRFSKGDVLYGKMRPYLNKVWVAEFEGLCSAEFLVFPQNDRLDSEFLALRLNAADFVTFANGQVSGERPRVDFEKVSGFPIALPPAAEQSRIVVTLKAALSAVQRAETAARRAQERLGGYRAATLIDAVTGELTRDWRVAQRKKGRGHPEADESLLQRVLAARRARWEEFELRRLQKAGKRPKDDTWKDRYPEPTQPQTIDRPELPGGWIWVGWEQVGFSQNGRSFPSKEYSDDGIKLLRPGNLYADGSVRWNEKNTRYLPVRWAQENPDLIIRGNELVMNLTAQSLKDEFLGRVCLTSEGEHCLLNQRLARLTPGLGLPKYFLYMFKSAMFRRFVDGLNSGSLIQHMFTFQLAQFALPFPPEAEQTEIVWRVDRRLIAAERLNATLGRQLERARDARQSLLEEAFSGRLVPQNPEDEAASVLLEWIRTEKARREAERVQARRRLRPTQKRRDTMQDQSTLSEMLSAAWERMGRKADASRLFDEAGLSLDLVTQFYEALRASPELRGAFQGAAQRQRLPQKPAKSAKEKYNEPKGRFRLRELWLEDFKNLKDYTVLFEPAYGLDVVLGWNGTGKSNLFEALVIIFRDLHEWWEKNRWPDKPMLGYQLSYEIDEHVVEVTWQPRHMKRPRLRRGPVPHSASDGLELELIRRDELPLPRFVFGYYSGPTNRLAEHFLPMKQDHYDRLRRAKTDDARTLARLLERRRFFCAETHHAKYVLLAFSYKEDPKISAFLENRLRIVDFESALFVIRRPRWAKPGSKAEDFWGATGIMRRVMERLRRYAIAPMVLEQTVRYGYRTTTEDHYYFFLPDPDSLHLFAADYEDARTFFLALESTDFSELIYDVKIQVRIKATHREEVSITFHQLSEGEQQLLMVLGLMRFTKSHQSLVLLDEPDTHLNPHWSVKYLRDLTDVMSDDSTESPEQQSSQILMATHDPIVIASLVKEQVHLLRRDSLTGACRWAPASVNPRGLGFTGILTSEMFGFRSDLDPETLADLDNRVRLVAKEEPLTTKERRELEKIDHRLAEAGFYKAFSDPYYAAFVRAWGRRHSELMANEDFITAEKQVEIDRIAREVLEEAVEEVEREVAG